MSKTERWIDLSGLPRKEGFGANKGKILIDWKNSIGHKCKFKYDDIEGEVEIVSYTSKGQKLTIKYLDYDLFEINTGNFQKTSLGKLLKKRTNEFKIELGQVFKDTKRDLIVIDRKCKNDINDIKYKFYKYHCNKCDNEDWVVESNLLNQNQGCNVCCNRIAKLGFNTIYDTDKWMINLGVSEEDSKMYTSRSGQSIRVKCPNCGREKYMIISNIYKYKSIGCTCSDGISYPEKFVSNLLNQLNIEYVTQYSPEWIKPKRYDFYFKLDNKEYIIETHGDFHYNEKGYTGKRAKTLDEEQENDKYKKELALNNGIDTYIELDCRKSNLDYIKNSIINSELNKIFDLSQIDWLKCEEFALSNIVKEICDYWHLHNDINNEELSTANLSKVFNLHYSTITNYLNKGSKLGWCNYNGKEELKIGKIKAGNTYRLKYSKPVEVFKNEESLGVFFNSVELSKNSEKLFKTKFNNGKIYDVANGKRKTHKGFTFKYVSKEEYEEYIKNKDGDMVCQPV